MVAWNAGIMHHRPHGRRSPAPTFLVGLDTEGHWIAVETHGRGGGIFADRGTAIRYAEFETGRRPRAVRFSAKPLRLL